jgi:8-amino-7-oxononanoate synthase
MNLPERWAALLNDLRAQGRYRALSLPSGIDLSSNDYLGYAGGRSVSGKPSAASSGVRSGTASRLLRGQHPVWEKVEAALAQWHGAPAALVMTSGYTANEGLLATVIEPHDWVASDALNHASIIDGLCLARAERFVYRHGDVGHLEAGLRAAASRRPPQRQLFVVTESLFGMDGDLAPLQPIVELAERHGAHVIVDEAHSTGCFGRCGSGCVDGAGLRGRVLATIHTGGKALGVAGAYICVSTALREVLVNRCRHFIFTTALPPAVGAWWLDILPHVATDHAGRAALHEGAALFRAELGKRGLPVPGGHYIVPLVRGDDDQAVQAARRLREAGFDIRAIRPPSVPPGTARLRMAIHADHSPEMLGAAAAAVAEVCQ